jgi:kinesin family protein 3/17
MSQKEHSEGHNCVVKMTNRGEVFVQKPFAQETPKQFTFDLSYDEKSSQVEIYQNTAAEIITNVLEGYNGTIFAYGQTGTGKTHTMSGLENDPDHKGIMPRSFEDIFTNIKQDSN